MFTLSCLILATFVVCTDGMGYLTDYRHKDFGIGAELQYPDSPTLNQQEIAKDEYRVYDRRHHGKSIPLQSAPSQGSSASVAASASAGAAASASAAAASTGSAASAAAASSSDHRPDYTYDQRQHHRIRQQPAPRYIPREYKNQPIFTPVHPKSRHQPVPQTPTPRYVTPRHARIYTPRTRATPYVQPTHGYRTAEQPIFYPRTPVYHQPTAAPRQPVYVSRTQAPFQRTQQRVYVQHTQAPVYVQPTIAVSSSHSCSSSTLCFCCRWTTRYTQTTKSCNQPDYGSSQQQVCVSIRNGVCVKFIFSQSFGQGGSYPNSCTSTKTERQCSSCCPSRYGAGMPRCTTTRSTSTTKQEFSRPTSNLQHPNRQRAYQHSSVHGMRSAPNVVASASAHVSAADYPSNSQVKGGEKHFDFQSYYSSGAKVETPRNDDSGFGIYAHRNHQKVRSYSQTVDCCATTRQPECCPSIFRSSHTRSPAVYKPQTRPYSVQQSYQRSSYNQPSYPRSNVVQTAWQAQRDDCCSTTREVYCCSTLQTETYNRDTYHNQIQTSAVASTAQQGDCCSSSRRLECCAPRRAAVGIPVSRSRTMCCGSSQPLVSCCVSLRLADCCDSSRISLCCSITNNVGKCCSGASTWGK